jgi:ABC-type branched-subunit amino acid transport system substrate-binding protein
MKKQALVSFAMALCGAAAALPPAYAAEVIVVTVAPETSVAAREYAQGAALYFAHVNATVAAAGTKITVVEQRDARPRPETREAVAYLTAGGRGAVQDVLPALRMHGTPLLTPDEAQSSEPVRLVFSTRPRAAEEAAATVRRLYDMGMRRIAIAAAEGPAGRAAIDAARARMAARGVTLAAAVDLPGHAAGIAAAADAVASAKVQGIAVVGETQRAAAFTQALRDRGSYALVVTGSSIDARSLRAQLSESAAIWLATADTLPDVQEARRAEAVVTEYRALQARYGGTAGMSSTAALEGFIAAKVLVEAVRRSGPKPTAAGVRQALETLADFDVGGARVSFRDPAASGLIYARISLLGSPH